MCVQSHVICAYSIKEIPSKKFSKFAVPLRQNKKMFLSGETQGYMHFFLYKSHK